MGDLPLSERVVRLDGTTATVVALAVRPGVADYYNLTVSQLHTYAVGAGQFVVHNCGDTTLYRGKVREGPPTSDDLGVPGSPNPNGAIDIKPKDGMVGPIYTGKQGLSTYDGMNPIVKHDYWWSVSESDLPDGLQAIQGTAKEFIHYSIAPARDMTTGEFKQLLDQIPWRLVS